MSTHHNPTGGVRWQVWASVIGGLGALMFVAYWMTPKAKPAATPDDDTAPVAKRRAADDSDWGGSSYSRRTTGRSAIRGRSSAPRVAPRSRLADAGAPDEVAPERTPTEKKPKLKREGWIRGKVVALPARAVIKTFTVVYARSTGGWFVRRSKQKLAKDGFPVGASKKLLKVTDPKGEFNLKVEAGRYVLQIKAEGFEPGNPAPAFASTTRWFRQTFGLLRSGSGTIQGKVVGRQGKPVAGATVFVLISGGSRWGWRMVASGRGTPSSARKTVTNQEGEFSLQRLPAGAYGVAVHAPGYNAWRQRGVELAPGETKDLGVIQLDGDTGHIKGFVYGSDGKGLSGVRVMAFARGKSGRTMRFARTESSGEYSLQDIPAGNVRMFASQGRGFMSARRSQNVKLKVGETKTVIFRFGVGGLTLKGKVTQADGTPVAEANVRVTMRGRRFRFGSSSNSGTTDANGDYSISGMEEGQHVVTVYIKGKPAPGGVVEVKDAETIHNVQLQGGEIAIDLLDKKTKKPLQVTSFAILTWKEGSTQRLFQRGKPGETLLFKNLPNVAMDLRVFSPGYSTFVQSGVYPGNAGKQEKLQIALEPAGKVSLTLQTPDKKVPERAWVRLLIDGKYQWVPSQPMPGGELLVQGLPPGAAHLQITARGYQPLKVTVNVPTKETGTATFFLTPLPEPDKKVEKPTANTKQSK